MVVQGGKAEKIPLPSHVETEQAKAKVGTDAWTGPVSRVCHLCGPCARFHAVVAALKFLMHFEHGALHFPFTLSPANYAAGTAPGHGKIFQTCANSRDAPVKSQPLLILILLI